MNRAKYSQSSLVSGEDRRVVRTKVFFAGVKKVLDNRAGMLYNKDRSEEERKTLGPTADLHIFKLYVQKIVSKKVKKSIKKGLTEYAGGCIIFLKIRKGD